MAKIPHHIRIRVSEFIAAEYALKSNAQLAMDAESWVERWSTKDSKPSSDSLFWGAILPEMISRLMSA